MAGPRGDETMSDTSSSDTSWHCPGADEHGFITLESLRRQAAASSLQAFERQFPVPGLLVFYRGLDPTRPDQPLDLEDQGVQLLTVSVKSAAILRYLGKVAFLAKRPGNPYAHLISIGRSSSNDITIAVDSVSKVHGYFVADGGGWSFTDHDSTNGSKIDEVELAAGEKHPLPSGSVLQLGLEVTLEMLSSEDLYLRARDGG